MDALILGMGLPAVYVASRLSAEGLSVGLFGKTPDMVPEPVSETTVNEFQLSDFAMNNLRFIARFNNDFELEEEPFSGTIIDVKRLHSHYLHRAISYGCEVLEGCDIFFDDGTRVIWQGREYELDAKTTIVEGGHGKKVPALLAGRIPFNEDTVEFYENPCMWVLPAGRTAIVGGKVDFSWHKFEQAAILKTYELTSAFAPGELVSDVVRLGRAAGHTTKEGFVTESLHHARLLVDAIVSENDLSVYEKAARASALRSWLEPQLI